MNTHRTVQTAQERLAVRCCHLAFASFNEIILYSVNMDESCDQEARFSCYFTLHVRRQAALLNDRSVPFTHLVRQESIIRDMNPAFEKPIWPLSSYAPAKNEPLLVTGLDQSFEELRVRASQALKAGNVNEYVSSCTSLITFC